MLFRSVIKPLFYSLCKDLGTLPIVEQFEGPCFQHVDNGSNGSGVKFCDNAANFLENVFTTKQVKGTEWRAYFIANNVIAIYKKIKLAKSVIQLRNEELGILPGDEKEKLKFYMMSFMDAFYKLIGEPNTNKLIEAGLIEFEVFGQIRGRSWENTILIVDEFQNITKDNAKTFLTRFSNDTKTIVLGDSGQIDLKHKEDSSLEYLAKSVKSQPEEGVEVVEFDESEIVRHRLTSYFIDKIGRAHV